VNVQGPLSTAFFVVEVTEQIERVNTCRVIEVMLPVPLRHLSICCSSSEQDESSARLPQLRVSTQNPTMTAGFLYTLQRAAQFHAARAAHQLRASHQSKLPGALVFEEGMNLFFTRYSSEFARFSLDTLPTEMHQGARGAATTWLKSNT
jgi:hypothetical protein